MKKHILILTIVALAATGLISCNGDRVVPPSDEISHVVEAVLVRDMNTELSHFNLTLKRNGVYLTSAIISLEGMTISSDTTGYFRQFTLNSQFPFGGSYNLRIVDSTILDTTLLITIPDSLSIVDAGFRNFTGSAEPVIWISSSGTDGYILATTTPPGAVSDSGYAVFVSGTLESSIPPEAFTYLLDRIEGVHKIYIASYKGTPMESDNMPFAMPATGGPVNNLTTGDLTGRIGGIVIAQSDTISVPVP